MSPRLLIFGINEHCALIEKMEASDTFNEALADNQVQNLADYFVTLPSEAAMKLWTVLGKGDNANVISLHKAYLDGWHKGVGSYGSNAYR